MPQTLQLNKGEFFEDQDCKRSVNVAEVYECGDLDRFRYAQIQSSRCGKDMKVHRIKNMRLVTDQDRRWESVGDRCFKVRAGPKLSYVYVEVEGSGSLDQFVEVREYGLERYPGPDQ